MNKPSRHKQVIDIEKLVSCLPGYENFDISTLQMKPRRKFIVRSTQELIFEKQQREGIRVWQNNSL
jgi:hypothetical protein